MRRFTTLRGLNIIAISLLLLPSIVIANNVRDSQAIHYRTKRQTVVGRDGRTIVQTKVNCDQADLIMVLDSSGSIGIQNWYKITNFTANIVKAFNIGLNNVRIGVVSYGNQADVAFHLNEYDNRQDILRKIQEIPWKDQETNTSGAIRTMRNDMFSELRGDRPDVQNVAVVITDGESNRDASQTIPEANLAKRDGIVMFSLGIGRQISMDELRGIANAPQDKYVFLAEDFDALQNIEVQVGDAACEAAAECRENADVAFVLDASGSVGPSNFEKMKDFVKAVIRDFDIAGGRMRVGLERFSNGEEAMFFLDTHRDRDDMLRAVSDVKYTSGRTNTAGALRMLREQMFTPQRGARSGTNRVAVVLTDGGSNNFQETLKMAKEARQAGITLLVVAVGGWVNWLEVNEIASDEDAYHVFKVESFDRFGDIQTQLRKTICNDDNMCAPNPCQNGGRCVVGVGQFNCLCPRGWAGRKCDIRCNSRSDVVLALDSSDSIGADKYNKLLNFGKDLARSLNFVDDQTRMAVITFANEARVRFQLNRFKSQTAIAEEISFPFMKGRTNTELVLRQIRENMFSPQNGDRRDVRNVVVIVTDGHSSDRAATFRQAVELRKKADTVIVIGVGSPSQHDKIEMEGIASDPDDSNVMLIGDYDNLVNITPSVVRAICNTEDECRSNPCQRGGRCVDGINGFTCECQRGSTGPLCSRAADGALDIVILVDVSGSIRTERFPLIIDFIKKIVDTLEIRPGRTRVGIGTFADDARVQFYLNTYERKEDVLQAVSFIRFLQGKTNTAAGLQMLRTQLFDRNRGDRDNAPNIAIVITDGQSNVNTRNTIPEAVRTRAQGIYVVVGTVGRSKDDPEIRAMASDPVGQNVVSVERYSQLNSMVDRLVQAFTNDQNECRSNPCRNGGTCLDSVGMFSCSCRGDYAGEMCDRRCPRQLDVVFAIDASGSIAKYLEWEQQLAKRLVRGLNFNNGRSRVGLLSYQQYRKVEFYLNKYANSYTQRQDILNALTFGRNAGVKGTNTASALRTMRSEVFSSSQGDRSNANNVAIVLTDGQSNLDRKQTIPEAESAKGAGIQLFAVGVGDNINRQEIQGIASDPDDRYAFTMSSENQIDSIADRILNSLCFN